MNSAIPFSSPGGLIGNMSCGNFQEYEANERGPSWEGLPVDMNVDMDGAMAIADGAATPEASTDGDYDSSDDEARRRLNKTLVVAPCIRLRDSCRWLSTHNSFRAQPALPIRESPKKPRIGGGGEGQCAVDDNIRGSGSGGGGGGASTPENASAAAGTRIMMTPAQAPSRLVQQVGRPMRGGTTDRHNRMKDSLKTLGRALNTSAKAPAALAIQAAASAALAQSPQAALTAVFASPHKRAVVRVHSNTNDENKANGTSLARKSTRAMVTRHSHSTSPLAPPKPVLSKKRRVQSCSTLTTPAPGAPAPRSYSSRRPLSKKSSLSSSSKWLEAAWATAVATAKRRAARERAKAKEGGNIEKQQQERLRSSRHRARSPPPVAAVSKVTSGGALDLSCPEDIDVDEVMNSGSEIRTPICRFLLPCWPEGVEGYEEVGGWRRLGGRAASERGATGGPRSK